MYEKKNEYRTVVVNTERKGTVESVVGRGVIFKRISEK
jgi:hypothetical protein